MTKFGIRLVVVLILLIGGVGYLGVIQYQNLKDEKSILAEQQKATEALLKEQQQIAEAQLKEQQQALEATQDEVKNLKNEVKKSEQRTTETIQKLTEEIKKESKSESNLSSLINTNTDYVVSLTCVTPAGVEGVLGASGVVFDFGNNSVGVKTTYIATNHHVLNSSTWYPNQEALKGFGKYPCIVANITNIGSIGGKITVRSYLAEFVHPASIAPGLLEEIDLAFLRIVGESSENQDNIIQNTDLVLAGGNKPNICSTSDAIQGKEIFVIGYPAIGGVLPTVTEGIISGYGSTYHLTTQVKIEQGNSGGGAFSKDSGCWLGIPTFASVGLVESLARLINVPKIYEILSLGKNKNWIPVLAP